MGRILVILIVLVSAVFSTIALQINSRKVEAPELVINSMAHIKAKALSNEALNYSIKNLKDGRIQLDQNEFKQTFSNFTVLDGTIDSISYVMNFSADTLTITSYVTTDFSGLPRQHASVAKVAYITGKEGKAFNCSKTVSLKGNARIIGGLQENMNLNINKELGKNMNQFKSSADNYYKNPKANITPISGITYVELKGNKKLTLAAGWWQGSGLLIVDGNLNMAGIANFQGVIWVNNGSVQLTGNSNIKGSVYVDTQPNKTVKMAGNSTVKYDKTIVNKWIASSGTSGDEVIEIISWDN